EPYDLVERLQLKSLLARDPPHQAIDTFDVIGAAKKRTGGGRRLAETFSCFSVLVERHHVRVVGAKPRTEFPHPVINLARFIDVGVDSIFDWNHFHRTDATIVSCDKHRPLRKRHKNRIVYL